MVNSQDSNMRKSKVLITGFGPFDSVPKNQSWEGVQAMDKDIDKKYNIELHREQVQVKYSDIDHSIPKLWKKLNPVLTIHVGVADTSCFLLETKAAKCGYTTQDIDGLCPAKCENCHCTHECLTTKLDVTVMKNEFNSTPPSDVLKADVSEDAGKFLCEYIYYSSLSNDNSRTLFVHVPYEGYTAEQIAKGLERILEISLTLIRNS